MQELGVIKPKVIPGHFEKSCVQERELEWLRPKRKI